MTRKVLSLLFVISPFVVMAQLFLSPAIAGTDDKETKNGRSSAQMDRLDQLVKLIGLNTPVAIVRFESDYSEAIRYFDDGKQKKKVRVPETFFMRKAIHIQGTFSLEGSLYKKPPRLGHIRKTLPLTHDRLIWNENYRRLAPLLTALSFQKENQPIHLLAVWPPASKGILDATFVGPLTDADVKYLTEVGKLLMKKPFPKIDQMDAERLLDSSNPWKTYLGLARLRNLKNLSAQHFLKAIESLPSQNVEAGVSDMFVTALSGNKKVQEGLTEQLSTFFAKTPPDKQLCILKAVNEHLQQESYRELVNLTALQNAARKYRQKIMNDPTRREVLREIDALLKLREKIKVS